LQAVVFVDVEHDEGRMAAVGDQDRTREGSSLGCGDVSGEVSAGEDSGAHDVSGGALSINVCML
jgi:hypothetical protein